MSLVQPDSPNYGSINEPRQMGSPPKPQKTWGPCGCTNRAACISIVSLIIAVLFTILATYYLTKTIVSNKYNGMTNGYDGVAGKPEEQKGGDGVTAAKLRLPNNIEPIHYNLTMKTYLPGYEVAPPATKNLTFEGLVTLTFKVLKSSRKITVNFAALNIVHDQCQLTIDNKPMKILNVLEQPKLEKLGFHLDDVMPEGAMGELKIVYTGDINEDLKGFYQSTYFNNKNEQVITAVSQMEPTDARRMVPCMDEPAFKANWTVTIIHPKGTTALSNGIDLSTEEHDSGFMKTRFKTTPKMSTYLLAVFVSAFKHIEKKTKRGTLFRIWARPEAINTTEYALHSGVKVIEYYEEFFGIPFPLEKQDMVAVPDFSAGAMENWGLVTYRETDLLYDPRIYSNEGKRRVAVVIAHELAHQWFGNLVTMKWWEDLFLNEGFATFVEYLGADYISDNDFKMDTYFIEGAQESALEDDKVASSHPLFFDIARAEDVTEAFDGISYEKGGSFIQMLRTVLGEKNFDKGITLYLNRHSYSNADHEDLWAALDETLPKDVKGPDGKKLNVKNFANQWTTQMGYPVITVKRQKSTSSTSQNASTTFVLTQERFKPNREALEKEVYRNPKFGYKWDVPIWYITSDDTKTINLAWLKRDSPLTLTIPSNSVLIINADSRGFYRTNYETQDWKTIAELLNKDPEALPIRAKTRLLFDAYEMANDDRLEWPVFLDLVSYVSKEKNYFPASAVLANMNALKSHYGSEPEKVYIEKFYKTLLDEPYKHVADLATIEANYKNDSQFYDIAYDLHTILNYCQLDSAECNEQFEKLFNEKVLKNCQQDDKLSDCVEIGGVLRRKVYCEGVKNNNNKIFKKMLQWYRNEQIHTEKDNILTGLACSKDITNLKSLLLLAMDRDDGTFRLQDASHVFSSVGSNPIAEGFLFKFLISRWDAIYASFKEDPSTLQHAVMTCLSFIRTDSEIQQLNYFKNTAKNANQYGWINHSVEGAQLRIKWHKKYFDKLTKEFKRRTAAEVSA